MESKKSVLPGHIIILLMSLSFYILMPVLGQQLINIYQLTMSQVAWLLNFRIIVQDICVLFGGLFCSRFGFRSSIVIGALTRGTGFLLYSLTANLPILAIASALTGIGGAFFFPAMLAYYSNNVSKEQLGQAISQRAVLDALGTIIGPVICTVFLLSNFFLNSLVSAIGFYISAIIAFAFFPRQLPNPSASKPLSLFQLLPQVFANKEFVRFAIVSVFIMFFSNNLNLAITAKMNLLDPQYPYLAYITMVASVLMVFLQVRLYTAVSKLLSIKMILFISTLVYGAGYLLLGASPNLPLIYVAVIITTFGSMLYSPSREIMLTRFGDGSNVATYYGALGLFQTVVNLAFTPILGRLFDISAQPGRSMTVWLFFGGFSLLVALLVMKLIGNTNKGSS